VTVDQTVRGWSSLALVAVSTIVVAPGAVAVLRSAPAGLHRSVGFATAAPAAAAKVTCAVGVPPSPYVLYCASPGITKGAYDHRGVVRLTPRGRVQVVTAGSDLLNAIDGNADQTAPRPVLAARGNWRRSGYSCTRRHETVSCHRGRRGFAVSPRRLTTF
jgi:hypothetical protein